MAAVNIRSLSDEAHRALKLRAARHNRSTEAQVWAILEAAVRPEGRLLLGTALSASSRKAGLTDADREALDLNTSVTGIPPSRCPSTDRMLGQGPIG